MIHWLQAPVITTALKDSSSLSTNTVITADLDLQQFVSKKRINRRHSSPHISYSPGPEPPSPPSHVRILFVDFSSAFYTVGPQDVRMKVIHSKPKLWHTTGVCLQPLPLLPTFPQCLLLHSHYQQHCQICWLYHSSRSDIRQ